MKSYFNKWQRHGLETGEYFCTKCGALMIFEDENCDSLICESCGYSTDIDDLREDDE